MNYLTTKDKLSEDEVKTFENIDGRLIMVETLKNKGLQCFPETRMIPLSELMNTAIIYHGWKFSKTVERYAQHYLIRFYRRNGYEVAGYNGKEQIKMPLSVFSEIETYEAEWRKRMARQV